MRKFFKFCLRKISTNLAILLILVLSLLLNTIGLIPNTLFHQNEPGVQEVADKLFQNIVFRLDFDPNIEPHPFKYASFIFYTQALARGILIIFSFLAIKFSGLNFGFTPKVIDELDFQYFVENASYFIGVPLLIISRFINVLYGVGCVILVYLICQKIFSNKYISLLSAFSLAVMPLHVRESHFSTADIPLVFFILLSFLFSIRLYQKPSIKNYLFAGIAAGFASSIKYYPLPLLPLFICCLFSGWRIFVKRFFVLVFSIAVGYIIAMPYVFIHYDKMLAFIPFVLTWHAPDQLDAQRTFLTRFLPTYFHQFHLKFLFLEGILPTTFIVGLFGLLVGLFKYKVLFLLVALVPIVHFIFINFYVKQIYEYIPLPILSFYAIFIGVGTYHLLRISRNLFKVRLLKSLTIFSILLIIYLPSLIYSLQIDLACSEDITDFQARDWVIKNIPANSRVAYHPGTRHPSIEMSWIPSEILGDFSLSELQEKDAEYLISVNGYYGVYTQWATDFFTPPENLNYNQYPNLAIEDIQKRSVLLAKFVKPHLCMSNSVYIFRLTKKLDNSSHLIYENLLDNQQYFSHVKLLNSNEETKIELVNERSNSGSVLFSYSKNLFNKYRDTFFYYTAPLYTDFIKADSNKKYTASLKFKPLHDLGRITRDGYLRVDFYASQNDLPILTVLSPKGKSEASWQKLYVTSIAPEDTNYIRIGFQSLGIEKETSFLIDDIKLYAD